MSRLLRSAILVHTRRHKPTQILVPIRDSKRKLRASEDAKKETENSNAALICSNSFEDCGLNQEAEASLQRSHFEIVLPASTARLRPALTRWRIMLRSNSAKAPVTLNMSLPAGVVMSIDWINGPGHHHIEFAPSGVIEQISTAPCWKPLSPI